MMIVYVIFYFSFRKFALVYIHGGRKLSPKNTPVHGHPEHVRPGMRAPCGWPCARTPSADYADDNSFASGCQTQTQTFRTRRSGREGRVGGGRVGEGCSLEAELRSESR